MFFQTRKARYGTYQLSGITVHFKENSFSQHLSQLAVNSESPFRRSPTTITMREADHLSAVQHRLSEKRDVQNQSPNLNIMPTTFRVRIVFNYSHPYVQGRSYHTSKCNNIWDLKDNLILSISYPASEDFLFKITQIITRKYGIWARYSPCYF